jgi:alpha-beta hydrolase superfamily lysophospholipase
MIEGSRAPVALEVLAMRISFRHIFVVAMLAALFWLTPAVPAQDGKKINIQTVDGVTLHGKFYAGKGGDAATVLLLHALGEKSSQKNWVDLAESLRAKGYAVLAFDFRGHGGSTTVDPDTFWQAKFPYNGLVSGAREKSSTIDFKGFDKRYYPALVNDIAAAKAFLERKNDARECNTNSLIVIGAEDGATLGAIWMNSEWHRYRVKTDALGNPMVGFGGQPVPDLTKPEGEATICGVWLSISSKLGARQVTLSSVLDLAAKKKAVPMVFVHSMGDKSGSTLAKELVKKIKPPKTSKTFEKYKFTDAVAIPNSSLKGANLLEKSLQTKEFIGDYLEGVVAAKGKEWMERDFRKSMYVWYNTGKTIIAKGLNDLYMTYSTYDAYISGR